MAATSGMLRRVAQVRTDISEERSTSDQSIVSGRVTIYWQFLILHDISQKRVVINSNFKNSINIG
jgi:hypothetical protein